MLCQQLLNDGECMDLLEGFSKKIRGKKLSVVLPEGQDERIILAARKLYDSDLAVPVILGKADQIEAAVAKAGVSLDGITIIAPKESDKIEAYTKQYLCGRDNLTDGIAKRMVSKPLFYGGMMVTCGDADAMVAGAATATATVIQAGVLTVGLAEGINTPSSFFMMVIPDFLGQADKKFIFADCAVNIDPDAEQLADIALASAASGQKLLGEETKVAMLSFSTKGSASHARVDKVCQALEIIKTKAPQLAVDGELQADSAIIPAVAAKKIKTESAVAGKANVLIFPDLDSGNIAYKLTQYMAKARAIGPFLQGFAKPVSDLSRGASVDDIVATSIISLAQVNKVS